MRNSKAAIGSLNSLHSKVRQEKKSGASAKAPAVQNTFSITKNIQNSSSDSDSSSSNSGSESDDDDDLAAELAKLQAKTKASSAKVNGTKLVAGTPAKPTSNGNTPSSAQKPAKDASSGSESEPEESDSDSPTTKPAPSKTKADTSKSEDESTSSSGSESESETETEDLPKTNSQSKTTVKAVNGNAAAEDSDSSSEDEDMPDAGAQVTANGAEQGAAVNGQDSSSEESDSGSESDDEGDGGNVTVARSNGKDTAKSTSQLSRAPWLNGSDFTLRKASTNNPGKEVSDFLSNANLEGKQVWYFTAPASLPITVLKDMEIDLAKATQGGSLLTHDGDDYGLDLEAHATTTQIQLLIPSTGGDKYTTLNRGIDSTVHLRRMAKFGPGGEAQATATDEYVPKPKPIREQPVGLRPRYTPIGVPTPVVPTLASSNTSKTNGRVQPSSTAERQLGSGSDVEMASPPSQVTPAGKAKSSKSGSAKAERKRKHAADEDAVTSVEAKAPAQVEKPAKRLKAQEANAKKQTPIQPPNIAALSSSIPSQETPKKTKEKKDKSKKDKTPKAFLTPSSTPTIAMKQTPVPVPTFPGMKR